MHSITWVLLTGIRRICQETYLQAEEEVHLQQQYEFSYPVQTAYKHKGCHYLLLSRNLNEVTKQ